MVYYWLTFAAVIVVSYLFGNVNFSIIISKMFNKDIRTMGSGNPGTMNMLRNLGKPIGAVTLLLDIIKGVLPSVLGWLMLGFTAEGEWALFECGTDKIGVLIGGFSVVLGHIYPVFYRFKGGKGVASAFGVAMVACFSLTHWWLPIVPVLSFGIAVLYLYVFQYGCITSFILTGIPFIFAAVMSFVDGAASSGVIQINQIVAGVLNILLYAFILFAHRGNIKRLFKREEKRTVIFGQDKRKARREEVLATAESSESESPAADTAGLEETDSP